MGWIISVQRPKLSWRFGRWCPDVTEPRLLPRVGVWRFARSAAGAGAGERSALDLPSGERRRGMRLLYALSLLDSSALIRFPVDAFRSRSRPMRGISPWGSSSLNSSGYLLEPLPVLSSAAASTPALGGVVHPECRQPNDSGGAGCAGERRDEKRGEGRGCSGREREKREGKWAAADRLSSAGGWLGVTDGRD